MKIDLWSRRMFLQGAGKTLLAIPFLPSLAPRAHAQTAGAIKRYIAILSSFEPGHASVWLPNSGTSFSNLIQPNRILAGVNGHHNVRWQSLREFAPNTTSILAPLYGSDLNPYLDSMNIMRSLDMGTYFGHDGAHILGSSVGNDLRGNLPVTPTIDHVLNDNRTFNPAGRPQIFCGERRMGTNFASYARSGTGAAPGTWAGDSLQGLYNTVFNNGGFPQTGQTAAHPRRNILSRVLEDYNRVMNSRYTSAQDRLTLTNAMDKFSDIQRGLASSTVGQCSHSGLSKAGDLNQYSLNATVGRAIADMITAAIICDAARSFTIGAGTFHGLFDGYEFTHAETPHNSHEPFRVVGGKTNWQRQGERSQLVFRYIVAPLLQNLSATDPSNGRSYLYNSLIHCGYESGQQHDHMSQPTILFGNAGGGLTSGNYIDYADRSKPALAESSAAGFSVTPGAANFDNNYAGVSYNRLLVTILQAFGLQPADYENNALNNHVYGRNDIGSQNTNLSNIGGYGLAVGSILGNDPWGVTNLRRYDLNQFRYRLPMP